MSLKCLALAAAALITAVPACAETYQQVATIAIPGEPINAFGAMIIDQASGLGYLADKDNRAVVVFDTSTDRFVSRIAGFVGLTKNGNTSGPNGLTVVKGELWVSDGDSSIKVVDLKSNTIAATLPTGGKSRANGMAVDAGGHVVIVANSNDDPPFLSLISTAPGRRIMAKIPIIESGENLERSAYHAPSDTFFTAIPVLRTDVSKGLLAQTDARAARPIKLYELSGCHPHSLQVVSATTIFLGCSSAHGANRKPGGDMAVFDIAAGRIVAREQGQGGNGGSTLNPKRDRYYHSTTAATLMVVDTGSGKLVQKVPTSRGARSSAVSLVNGRIYVATSAKTGPCGGCIAVYAAK
jgi:DNA-binding beta-propeller fold protein YncE